MTLASGDRSSKREDRARDGGGRETAKEAEKAEQREREERQIGKEAERAGEGMMWAGSFLKGAM